MESMCIVHRRPVSEPPNGEQLDASIVGDATGVGVGATIFRGTPPTSNSRSGRAVVGLQHYLGQAMTYQPTLQQLQKCARCRLWIASELTDLQPEAVASKWGPDPDL